MLDISNQRPKITEEYFKVCAELTPLLEELRLAIFSHFKTLLPQLADLSLSDIASKLDYEKVCNSGLYARHSSTCSELRQLSVQDMIEIQEHCNDMVMK